MNTPRTRFFVSVVLAALLSPIIAAASCPTIVVECPNGKLYSCAGTQQGDSCIYSASCLNGGKCGGDLAAEEGGQS